MGKANKKVRACPALRNYSWATFTAWLEADHHKDTSLLASLRDVLVLNDGAALAPKTARGRQDKPRAPGGS